jgi:hypothetical protein
MDREQLADEREITRQLSVFARLLDERDWIHALNVLAEDRSLVGAGKLAPTRLRAGRSMPGNS